MHENERETLLKKSMKERKRMDKGQNAVEHYMDDVIIALNQRHAAQEMEIKGEYNSIKEDVRNKVWLLPRDSTTGNGSQNKANYFCFRT